MFDTNVNNAYGGYVFDQGRGSGTYGTKQSSTLTAEERARLVKNENAFSLALNEIDVIRGFCNHRSEDGMSDTLTNEPDGTVKCWVCNYKFSPVDPSLTKEDVQDSVNLINDILQTIKLLFVDMPVSAQREFFQIIPLLDKVPQLFELATRNFSKHENFNAWGYKGANMNTMNMFNMLSGVLGGAGMGPQTGMGMSNPQSYSNMPNPVFGAFGTPVGGMGMGAPMGAQPMGMMGMGAVDAYGRPMGYNPQMTGYSYGMETEEERKKREEEERKRREEEEARRRAAAASGTVNAATTFTA